MANRSVELSKQLAKEYGYQPIPPMFAEEYHNIYRSELPDWISENGDDRELFDSEGNLICRGYTRVVVGDYGAFIEFSDKQAARNNFMVERGQEYRIKDPRFSEHIKYEWWTTFPYGPKLYFQRRTVPYADYRVGFWYISPFEVTTKGDKK